MVRIVLLLVLFDAAVGWRALDMPMVAIIPTYFSRWARGAHSLVLICTASRHEVVI